MKFNIKKMGMAFAGGAIGGIAAQKYEDYLIKNGKPVKDKQTALLVAGVAAGVHYLGKGKLDDLACGILGAAGADLGTIMMNEMASDEPANGTPPQLSPQQMNGLRERVMEIRKQRMAGRGNASAGLKSGGTGTGVKLGRSGDRTSFYVNPYTNSRVV